MFYRLRRLLRELQRLARARRLVLVRELSGIDPAAGERLLALRLDVERDPGHALGFTRRLHALGLRATFYFHSLTAH
jgi:hypothetical protein